MSTGSGEDGRLADKDQGSSGFESLLAQLRRKSDQDTSSASIQHPHDLLSHFGGASMQQQQQQQHRSPVESYYGHQQLQPPQPTDSPSNAPPSYANNLPSHFAPSLNGLPAAPTPPVGGSFPNAQFPPSLLGSIGSGRPTGDRGAPSSHLLSLLKFSGHSSSANSTVSNNGSNIGSSSNLAQPPMVPLHGNTNTGTASANNSINGGSGHHHLDVDSEPESQLQHSSAAVAASIIHAPAPAPSDPTGLLAALIQGTLKDEPPKPEPATEQASLWQSTSQSNETQQYLLNLLNRPKPSQSGESFDNSEPAVQQDSSPAHHQHQYQTQTQHQHQHQHEHHHQHDSQLEHQHRPEYTHYNEAGDSSTGSPATLTMPQTTDVFDYQIKDTGADSDVPGSVATLFSHNNPFDGLGASPSIGHPHTPKSSTGPGSVHSPAQSATSVPKTVQILRKPASLAGRSSKPSSANPSPAVSPNLTKGRHEPPTSHTSHTSHQVVHPIVVEVSPREEDEYEGEGEGAGEVAVATALSEEGLDSDFKNDYADEEPARESATQSGDDSKEDSELNQHNVVQQEISMDLEDMANAKTEEEFQAAAQAAGRALKHELERDDTHSALEQNLSPDVAKAVREIVDEAVQGGVADSWESADAEGDETPVAEEQAVSVKVFNFPMKPWISIEVQDDDRESRPVFRDESVLDIARLKKEFDQIDRNLVASSENYMVYGMSKAGGLRVIRQSDGRDAKLFTDTKDRIFNVAMSHNNDAEIAAPKESVIGTGISGTVYWVQIRDGDKDHLEYAHPELYGFALPPIMSHEGDTPGGVLKTRARTSTGHPEYFAVGRGKSINIVWPGFVMKNNLFQPGHDRVVDTEKLSKQCSLKINTGKAGKDFTFSQDDSVVVSLDKSGRVKFWDVRDLTAAHEDSDPASPMPAHTSMEVKEPLLTLTTTPEGEKAWPTSVLLLDKLRPYQKRCALRYMIVGMKQNHTLQLWDLALGKPVQEFNLPHSKESDAVCSVMYHPPTGMIVVGHPTRNSVYFLHLSAPKYAMKSMSQVEYIQRLNAGDSSIPQPESTAVISGLREYSLANRGALRSLDILQNPAANADGEDPTLFELYAMHSKGVSCIVVRQGELGWTKDNKVMDPVDAVLSGKVKIGKLKAPPQQPAPAPADVRLPEDTPAAHQQTPRVIATRTSARELFQDAPAVQDTPTRKPVGASITKMRSEPKDEDAVSNTMVPAGPSTDKTEKKGRKKKAATASNNTAGLVAAAAAGTAGASAATIASERSVPTPNGSAKSSTSTAEAFKSAGQPGSGPAKANGNDSKATLNVSQEVIQTRINTMEARICERVSSSVHVAFDDMRKYIDQQFRSRDTDFENKQRKLLDMVSNVLNDNTEQVLGKIVHKEFETAVLPTLRDDVARSIIDSLGSRMSSHVSSTLQKELQRTLPGHVTSSLRSQEVSRAISDKIVHAVASHVDSQLSKVVATELIPTISSISTQSAHTTTQDIHKKVSGRIGELEEYHAAQNAKIDTLLSLYDDAMMRWLQSNGKEEELFRHVLVNYPPDVVGSLQPLVLLSVGTTVTQDLDGPFLVPKLNWVEMVLLNFYQVANQLDDQTREITPSVLLHIRARLEQTQSRIAKVSMNDPSLKSISQMINIINRITIDDHNTRSDSTLAPTPTSNVPSARPYATMREPNRPVTMPKASMFMCL
ncbi:hypothetical protein F503_00775 [Ophiostoma piceae UAMH 11346]|uniref:EDC4-like protein pdc1 beta-propeller domain-containing protein n=1 Tax=Ophiostoma piceae (strain UAMH 11346) TaxID=1262450 RepID=S3C5B9_OPHP1|nr:hypothetical protein F503_00775 [Ophiostoma piceae UAMH 11346]